jgi:hypothetical protein
MLGVSMWKWVGFAIMALDLAFEASQKLVRGDT